MNRKLVFGTVLMIIVSQLTFGQTKVYNGNYNSLNFKGNVIYNYAEETERRIFEGSFTFKTTDNSVKISGSYFNDLKNGSWNFNLTNIPDTDLIFNYVISANVSGKFNNGNIDGDWNLNRTKVISFSNSGISNIYQFNLEALSYMFDGNKIDFKKSTTMTEKSSASFKNNRFSGSFSYSVNGGKSIVNGQFNDQGYFDGNWMVNYYQDGILHFQTRTYLNGVLVTIKNKNNSTGNVTTVYDKTSEVNEFFQNFNSLENLGKIGENFYNLIEGKTSESNITFLEDAISIWYNNSSLSKSAYIFEIERGTNKLSAYPERKIILDKVRTEEAKQEKKRIADELRKKKEAEEEELRKIKLEKEKQQQQEKWAEQEKIKKFESSDYGKIQNAIKKEFNNWLTKREFETQQEFENRIEKQSLDEFNKISDKVIFSSKNEKLKKKRYGVLGDYDIESESFILNLYGEYSSKYEDEINLKIPKNLAQNVKSKFSGFNYKENKIIIIPQDFVLIDNKWVLSSALIVLNSKFPTETWFGLGGYTISKQSNGKVLFSSGYPTPAMNKYRIKNIKQSDTISNDLYFYEWSISDESFYNPNSIQKINLSIEDLGIILLHK